MQLPRMLGLAAVVLGALSGCNRDNIHEGGFGIARFQPAVSTTDVMMIDTATGDLWRLDESTGTEKAEWLHYADAPKDVKGGPPQHP